MRSPIIIGVGDALKPEQQSSETQKTWQFARVRGIAPGEWRILASAWAALLLVDLGLRRRGFPRVRQWAMFRVRPGHPGAAAGSLAELERLHQLVAIAARHHLYPMLCLRRALVLQWLLAARGLASEVRLGVARGEAGLDAHAWVEWNGQILGEAAEVGVRYRPLHRESAP